MMSATQFPVFPNALVNAVAVAFLSSKVPISSDTASSTSLSETSEYSSSRSNCRDPSVMVPVLSRQSTSVRAKVSILYNSWTSAFLFASFSAPTVIVTPVNKISPAGIMPNTDADEPSTAVSSVSPSRKYFM